MLYCKCYISLDLVDSRSRRIIYRDIWTSWIARPLQGFRHTLSHHPTFRAVFFFRRNHSDRRQSDMSADGNEAKRRRMENKPNLKLRNLPLETTTTAPQWKKQDNFYHHMFFQQFFLIVISPDSDSYRGSYFQ